MGKKALAIKISEVDPSGMCEVIIITLPETGADTPLNDYQKGLIYLDEKVKASEVRVKELEQKLRETKNVLKNQVRVNTEHYHDNKALKERIEFLEGKVKEAYFSKMIFPHEKKSLERDYEVWAEKNNIKID